METASNLIDFDPNAEVKFFKKGELIQKADSHKTPVIYVKKGILKSYIIDSKGKEHIYMFACEGWIIGDLEAIEYEQPAQLYIECLEDCEVLLFDRDTMLHSQLDAEQVVKFNKLLSRRIGRLQRRVIMLMAAPAIDRYKYFLEIYPDMQNRVPQKMIASYLGIAPQTLSTIRAQMAHEVK